MKRQPYTETEQRRFWRLVQMIWVAAGITIASAVTLNILIETIDRLHPEGVIVIHECIPK